MAVTLPWPHFVALLFLTYLAVNVGFAVLYSLVPGSIINARPHSLRDAFFFSFETLATVGYGEMYPGSLYGHLLACAEIVVGMAFSAIMTGLTFVRFSRPRAKFIMADKLIVCLHNGVPTMMLRIGNGRVAPLAEARATLNVLLSERTPEGVLFRRVEELPLLRSRLPIFPLTWTLMHVIDESSPLHGMDAAMLVTEDANLFVTIEARDPALSTTVHEVHTYPPDAITFGVRYVDVISSEEDGTPLADMTRISDTEPDVGPEQLHQGWSIEQKVQED